MTYVVAYALSIGGGWFIAGICVYWARRLCKIPREFFRWIDIWVGGTERIVATTLVLLAPGYLAVFIGGWIALKFAANWKRRENEPGANEASLIFLVGNVWSFAVAIAVGVVMNPGVLDFFAKH